MFISLNFDNISNSPGLFWSLILFSSTLTVHPSWVSWAYFPSRHQNYKLVNCKVPARHQRTAENLCISCTTLVHMNYSKKIKNVTINYHNLHFHEFLIQPSLYFTYLFLWKNCKSINCLSATASLLLVLFLNHFLGRFSLSLPWMFSSLVTNS